MGENKTAFRITRSRAKALDRMGGIPPSLQLSLHGSKKHGRQTNIKRAPSNESKASATTTFDFQRKRRVVLADVTNISRKCNNLGCLGPSTIEVLEVAKTELEDETSIIRTSETQGIPPMMKSDRKETAQENTCHSIMGCSDLTSYVPLGSKGHQMKDDILLSENCAASNHLSYMDIVSNSEDVQACTLYAHDIYDTTRTIELDQKPATNYMEELQKHITPIMRGILIDWLVEVSEEYKLVSDTLYLTVNFMDRFLSQSCIERQRLQLLGVTCMLIASKYEEICAPSAEDFCFITDNTYTRREVLKMEGEVLNLLKFQLSVPTTKTFLRRFVQVPEASCKDQCPEFEHLTNFLAELTLVEYSFLKFLPSAIAASVVFLARWILNQPNHPWNPTLEHYTNYSASELEIPVLALEDLRLNANGCSLNAILQKYRQQKFLCVATLAPERSVVSVFQKSG